MRLPFLRRYPSAQDSFHGDDLAINTQTMHQYYHTVVDHGEGPADPVSQAIERRAKRLSRMRLWRARMVNAVGLLSVAVLLAAGWSLTRVL